MGALFYKGRFRNRARIRHPRPKDLFRWALNRRPGPWRWVDVPSAPPPPRAVADGELRATLIGHATVLLQMDGLNVLTDPIWSARCSPVPFAGPERHRPPAVRLEDLPPIHCVLLSHDHYDHLDMPTLRRLGDMHAPVIVTGLRTGRMLRRGGLAHVHELDWWQTRTVPGIPQFTITATPAQHFSGRSLFDRDRTLWCGFDLCGPSGRIFFAGDTGYADHFQEVRERLGPPRLALLPIGAYRPEWVMRRVHMTPADAVRAHQDLQASTSLGIHFGTFRLTDDGMDEPPEALALALAAAGLPAERFQVPTHGAGIQVPSPSDVTDDAAE
ncbi:MAG: MBL fold metallo-hydrolase [Myxococcota bacterium]